MIALNASDNDLCETPDTNGAFKQRLAMPELPGLTVYPEHLERRILGQELERIRIAHPFLLRPVEPAPAEAGG